jgi:phage baseplate assembly protein W
MAIIVEDKWRGIGAPLGIGVHGYFTSKTTIDLIKSSLTMILSTYLGSRIMRPDFGSVLPEILFDPVDSIMISKIQVYIPEAIRKFEPRLSNVSVTSSIRNKEVNITISATIVETGDPVKFYLNAIKNKDNSLQLVV